MRYASLSGTTLLVCAVVTAVRSVSIVWTLLATVMGILLIAAGENVSTDMIGSGRFRPIQLLAFVAVPVLLISQPRDRSWDVVCQPLPLIQRGAIVSAAQLHPGLIAVIYDFGDGQTKTENKPDELIRAEHQYAVAGTYQIRLTFIDAAGTASGRCRVMIA